MTFKPSWNLSVNEDHILDFLSHPSVLTEYHLIQRTELYERDYYIRYGGAAVQLTYTETTDSAAILNEQYLQVRSFGNYAPLTYIYKPIIYIDRLGKPG